MNRKNRPLVADEPVEVQACKKVTDHSGGIYGMYPKLVKNHRNITARNRLELDYNARKPPWPLHRTAQWVESESDDSTHEFITDSQSDKQTDTLCVREISTRE